MISFGSCSKPFTLHLFIEVHDFAVAYLLSTFTSQITFIKLLLYLDIKSFQIKVDVNYIYISYLYKFLSQEVRKTTSEIRTTLVSSHTAAKKTLTMSQGSRAASG